MSGADNATRWTDIALGTLRFACGAADVVQWRCDNARYLTRLQKAYPPEYQRIEDAIVALEGPKA